MREKNSPPGDKIQQVTSIGGLIGVPTFTIYCSSKFAVEGFTEALNKELQPEWNIKLTCIEPGPFRTDRAYACSLPAVLSFRGNICIHGHRCASRYHHRSECCNTSLQHDAHLQRHPSNSIGSACILDIHVAHKSAHLLDRHVGCHWFVQSSCTLCRRGAGHLRSASWYELCSVFGALLPTRSPWSLYRSLDNSSCQYCPLSNGAQFFARSEIHSSQTYQDIGLVFVYIGFNIAAAVFLYYIFRVRQGSLFRKIIRRAGLSK